jgi:hypothetical protein
MNLDEIGKKYKISDSYLNSKEDGLMVAAKSIDDLIRQIEYNIPKDTLIKNLKTLSDFLRDVKSSTF